MIYCVIFNYSNLFTLEECKNTSKRLLSLKCQKIGAAELPKNYPLSPGLTAAGVACRRFSGFQTGGDKGARTVG